MIFDASIFGDLPEFNADVNNSLVQFVNGSVSNEFQFTLNDMIIKSVQKAID